MAVYMVQNMDGGPVKIGFTENLRQRLNSLQVGLREPLQYIRILSGTRLLERRLHERFASNRLTGEWFTFSPDMLTIQLEELLPPLPNTSLPTPDEIEIEAHKKGLSVAAMCRRADVDPSAFQRWKAGRNAPTIKTVKKMMDAIEREPDQKDTL